jgi:site-specific DNA-methyltransferase (adenine-specific)
VNLEGLGKPYFERGGVRLFHGDALEVLARMESGSVDVVLTDPPYSSGARQAMQLRSRGSMRRNTGPCGTDRWFGMDNLTSHGFAMLVRLFGVESLRVCKRDGHLFSFIDWRQWPVLAGALESSGWSPRACLVWDKGSYGMGNGFRQQAEFIIHASKGIGDNFLRHDVGTVLRVNREPDTNHPTAKPLAIARLLLTCVPGSVVLDPFAGSGTTLAAAIAEGWQGIGIEINERYCEIAAARLEQGMLPLKET